jgi:hypothetical protein
MTAIGTISPTAHGMMTMAWDDAAFPAWFWDGLDALPNGCWVWSKRRMRSLHGIEYVVTRLLRCEWRDVLAAVPTCGTIECLNPAHLCCTLRTPLSTRDSDEG